MFDVESIFASSLYNVLSAGKLIYCKDGGCGVARSTKRLKVTELHSKLMHRIRKAKTCIEFTFPTLRHG